MLVPKLFTTVKSYTRSQFTDDLIAGVIVGIVACRSPSHLPSPAA